MPLWLLDQSTLAEMQRLSASYVPTAEQVAAYEARIINAGPSTTSRLLTVAGNVAEIKIEGVITDRPSFFAFLFGGGNLTFKELDAAIAEAEADPEVTEVILDVGNGPGSTVDGLFSTIEVLRKMTKPLTARVRNLAASGAFGLVTQASKIIATNKAARFGSVGVAVDMSVFPEDVSITSTEAPNKRPDVTTEAGKAVVVEELDALHALFAEAIGAGRGKTVEVVNAEFGRGATFVAEEALKRGMIDSITASSSAVKTAQTKTATSGTTKGIQKMDKEELQAKHPAVYAAVLAEGREMGVTQEKERVAGFAEWGTLSGDMATAMDGIKTGRQVTEADRAKFTMAGMTKRDQGARLEDNQSAAGADTVDSSETSTQASEKEEKAAASTAKILELAAGYAGVSA